MMGARFTLPKLLGIARGGTRLHCARRPADPAHHASHGPPLPVPGRDGALFLHRLFEVDPLPFSLT